MLKKLRRAIYPIDYFRITPGLNFKRSYHFTFFGSILTLLMYIGLMAYFIFQLVEMVTVPITRSNTKYGQVGESMDLSRIMICQEFDFKLSPEFKSKLEWTSYLDIDEIHAISAASNLTLQRCNDTSASWPIPGTWLCLCFPDETKVFAKGDARSGLRIYINNTLRTSVLQNIDAQDPDFRSRFVLSFPSYSFDPEILNEPLQEWWWDMYTYSDPNGRITDYYLDKIVYEIDKGYFLSSIERKEGISLSFIDSSPQKRYIDKKGYDVIHVLFSGQIITNTRSFIKITEIFAAISGLQKAFALFIIILLGKYFQFKYHQNLLNRINQFKRSYSNIKIVDNEPKKLRQEPLDKNDNKNKEIRIGYFSYILEKLKGIFMKSKPKSQYLAEEKSEVEVFDKEIEKIQGQLDIANLMCRLNNYEALLNENKILIQTLMAQNENSKDRISNLEALLNEKHSKE